MMHSLTVYKILYCLVSLWCVTDHISTPHPPFNHRRFVSNKEAFLRWCEVAKQLNNSKIAIGGNAPVMAQRFALEGWNVLLGSMMKQSTARMMPSGVLIVGNVSEETQEDTHLILEYGLGRSWGPFVSPRANRYIIHSDYSNMMLESLDPFSALLKSFKPSLVVVGGLQMLDNFPYKPEIRTEKLGQLSQMLATLPRTTKIHFEMASITEERLMKEFLDYVLPYADSMGMNEQELANLCSFLEYGNVTLVSDPYPRVAKTLDQMRVLYNYMHEKQNPSHRPLTRVHVHTLAYQAILVSKHSNWRNMHGAVAKASLTAHRHVCASNEIDTKRARLVMDDSFRVSRKPGSHRMPLVDSAPIMCWGEDHGRICVAPNLVCTNVIQTAGGGDNISAAGLVLQL